MSAFLCTSTGRVRCDRRHYDLGAALAAHISFPHDFVALFRAKAYTMLAILGSTSGTTELASWSFVTSLLPFGDFSLFF